ncbi:hypothetical protein [Streptomyces sp. HD]|uniref:hypothetical protein n=1 Tax=Streptomyces sp. HD TaxID=3020892 RepID=UPI00232F07F1|nr:hypothetical protein [Streptomyces sp. HD]MDC0768720.1 hypothetical protein [Streptomyces sp. HD]
MTWVDSYLHAPLTGGDYTDDRDLYEPPYAVVEESVRHTFVEPSPEFDATVRQRVARLYRHATAARRP